MYFQCTHIFSTESLICWNKNIQFYYSFGCKANNFAKRKSDSPLATPKISYTKRAPLDYNCFKGFQLTLNTVHKEGAEEWSYLHHPLGHDLPHLRCDLVLDSRERSTRRWIVVLRPQQVVQNAILKQRRVVIGDSLNRRRLLTTQKVHYLVLISLEKNSKQNTSPH